MTAAVKSLSDEALLLSPAERLSLACSLIESVESEDAPSPESAWEKEIQERIARFDSGETKEIPASEVFMKLREIAPAK
ncbi:MAG: addiction module protein [Luteolibacter sp.]